MRSPRPGPARRRPGTRRLVACLLLLALRCEPEAGAPAGAGTSHQSAAPLVHNAFGLPGPWWRATGAQDGFDDDVAACRRESTAARQRPGEADPLAAAYRTFLDCMSAREWKRGTPPLAGAPQGREPVGN